MKRVWVLGGLGGVWRDFDNVGRRVTTPPSMLRVATSLCTREAYATALPWQRGDVGIAPYERSVGVCAL